MDIMAYLILYVYIFFFAITSSMSASHVGFGNGALLSEDSLDAIAFRVEDGEYEVKDNQIYVYINETYTLRIFGKNIGSNKISLTFTKKKGNKGLSCDDIRSTEIYQSTEVKENIILFHVTLPKADYPLYFCIREENQTSGTRSEFIHQGHDAWMVLQTKSRAEKGYMLPLWLQILVVVILLVFSGLFSGLNLGIMSMDQTELNIMIASGTEKEKQYARAIKPLRKRGNFILCTILLGNVLVNTCLTILMDNLTGSGWYTITGATVAIVIFGEILPQAICSRYGLAVGAKTTWFIKTFMLVTFPLSFPISLILDKLLGEEIGYVYTRDRLRELLRLAEKDIGLLSAEVNIITGALELSKKMVGDIMTKIDDVFMIEYNSILDFETLTKIMDSGYTRIPVYEEERTNVIALLNTKDLALVDPDNKSPLKDITAFYKRPLLFVFEDMRLDVILQDFKKGGSHMAMVQKVVNDGPGDPFYQVIGLVTLEDVIEEIIQAEINDEFDVIIRAHWVTLGSAKSHWVSRRLSVHLQGPQTSTRYCVRNGPYITNLGFSPITTAAPDNRNRKPLGRHKDYSVFNLPSSSNMPRLTPQLQLASFQFLSATLTPFRPPHMTERILHKLMGQNIVFEYKLRSKGTPFYLYVYGRPADCFILIVQGKVLVQSGKEQLTYEAGSFAHFGLQSLLTKNEPPSTSDPSSSKINAAIDKESQHLLRLSLIPSSKSDRNKPNASEANMIPASGPFYPDYTVRALTDLQYLRINREQYSVAWKVSQLEQELQKNMALDSAIPDETFENEWKKNNRYFDNVDIFQAERLSRYLPHPSQMHSPVVSGGLFHSLRKTFMTVGQPTDLSSFDTASQATAPRISINQKRVVTWSKREAADSKKTSPNSSKKRIVDPPIAHEQGTNVTSDKNVEIHKVFKPTTGVDLAMDKSNINKSKISERRRSSDKSQVAEKSGKTEDGSQGGNINKKKSLDKRKSSDKSKVIEKSKVTEKSKVIEKSKDVEKSKVSETSDKSDGGGQHSKNINCNIPTFNNSGEQVTFIENSKTETETPLRESHIEIGVLGP